MPEWPGWLRPEALFRIPGRQASPSSLAAAESLKRVFESARNEKRGSALQLLPLQYLLATPIDPPVWPFDGSNYFPLRPNGLPIPAQKFDAGDPAW